MNGPIQNAPRERAAAVAVCLAATLYFAWQFVVYFSESSFFGIGLAFLINFDSVTGWDYLDRFVFHSGFYPPLYFVFLFLAFALFGFHILPILAVNALFTLGGAAYLYGIGNRLGGRIAGAAAFAFFLLAPATTIMTKTLIIESPILLFLPAMAYHALASGGFRRAGHSAAAGAFFALGMLTKWTFLAYACPVAVVVLIPLFRDADDASFALPSARQWRNLAIAVGVLFALAAPWYLGSLDPELFRQSAKNDPTFPGAVGFAAFKLKLAADWRYLWLLAGGKHLLAVVGALAVAGLIVARRRGRVLLWLFAAGAPVVLFAVPNHLEDRYLWPIFTSIAVLVAVSAGGVLSRLPGRGARWAALVVLCGWLAVNNWDNFVRERGMDEPVLADRNYAEGTLLWERADSDRVLDAVVRAAERIDPGGRPVTLTLHPLAYSQHLAATHLRYHKLRGGERFARVRIVPMGFYKYPALSAGLRDRSIDFVVYDARRFAPLTDPNFDPDEHPLHMLFHRDYVDQSTGVRLPAINADTFREDVRILTDEYRVVDMLELSKSTVVIAASPTFLGD